MADFPVFSIVGPFRCGATLAPNSREVCGEIACFMSAAVIGEFRMYFCAEHRAPGDKLIAGAQLVQRVSVTTEVTLCGTSHVAKFAEREGLARLERAILRAGGVINLHSVRSVLGRYAAPAFVGTAQGAGGGAQ